MVCIWDKKIRLLQYITLKSFWQCLVLPGIKLWIISAWIPWDRFSPGIKSYNSIDVHGAILANASWGSGPYHPIHYWNVSLWSNSPAWSTSPVLVIHALGVAVIISIQSVLLEWNCLEIMLSAAHLAFGKFAKRFLALFWNKDSHLYWDFGSIPYCRIFSKLLGASLPHSISWLIWLPSQRLYAETDKILLKCTIQILHNPAQRFPANLLRFPRENNGRYLKCLITEPFMLLVGMLKWSSWEQQGAYIFILAISSVDFLSVFIPEGK